MSKIYKQLIQLNIKKKKKIQPYENNGQNIWIDVFPKKTYRQIGKWKDAQHANHQRNANQKP